MRRPLVAAALAAALTLAGLGAAAPSRAAAAGCPVASRPALAPGDTGACVTALQEALQGAGYDLPASGTFDDATEAAVRRFQASRQGPAIDGRVAAATWAALTGEGRRYSIERGPTDGEHVILTFDDCPRSKAAFTSTLLAAEDAGIRLVLFPYADCLAWGLVDPAFARAHGHHVFSHSATHAHLDELSRAEVVRELGKPAIQGPYGRPPYGGWNWTVLDAFAARGMRMWLWTYDTLDWTGRSRADLVADVVENARPGDTVLAHLQYAAFDAGALAMIKEGLARRGLALCRNTGPVSATDDVVC